jgi:phospholipid-binding lipoprotein MlaA
LLTSLGACASLPQTAKPDPRDSFERYNRWMYSVNDAIDRGAVLPMTHAYVNVVPKPVRRGVSNFFDNLGYPRTIVNDLLQAKLANGGHDTIRLVLNSVFGLGFFDPATRAGLERHDEDFGQTLGKWGVASGSYLVLPILGPSTVRDAFGRVPDEYTTGRHYIKDTTVRYSVAALDAIAKRAALLEAEALIKESFDRYAFVRNAWLQRRNYLVHDGEIDETPPEPPPDDRTGVQPP